MESTLLSEGVAKTAEMVIFRHRTGRPSMALAAAATAAVYCVSS